MLQPSVEMVEKISLKDLRAARLGGIGFRARTQWALMTQPAQKRAQILDQRKELARTIPHLNVWKKSIDVLEQNMARVGNQ